MNTSSPPDCCVALQMHLLGQVQGIGYRPALARIACDLGLVGWVRNTSHGIELHVEGSDTQVNNFVEQCACCCPAQGIVHSTSIQQVHLQRLAKFSIIRGSEGRTLSTPVPPDLAVCSQCRQDVNDAANRRYGYLLTSCTQCGPRYSIIESMPYEREATSMHRFELCELCRDEYSHTSNRRYHAQTNCCNGCGPNYTNLREAVNALRDCKIVCVKGIGGYQLLVDARNSEAVQHLRYLKGRKEKPFAIMVSDIREAEEFAYLHPLESELLQGSAAPIVVLPIKQRNLDDAILKGLTTIGLMLPASPVHEWLSREIGPLVVTSANYEGEPIAYDEYAKCEAIQKIAAVCLDHNRPILRPIDDSVVRVMGQQTVTLRLARGLAPLSLNLKQYENVPPVDVLAVGAHQKVAIALANGSQEILGPHLGDMDTLENRQRFVDHVADLSQLYQCQPAIIAHDAHADYFTTRWAQACAIDQSIRTIAVQHHHAHIAAGMLERGWLDREVIGIAWDGTGLGSDGTIWGGEVLRATCIGFERIACFRPFLMPGGEAAIREPWRMAESIVHEVRRWDPNVTSQPTANSNSCIESLLRLPAYSPITSSVGRLFDAVAILVLADRFPDLLRADYEGHFAALLESSCDQDAVGVYPMPICGPETLSFTIGVSLPVPSYFDWRPMIRAILEDRSHHVPHSTIAMRFHRTLANTIQRISEWNHSQPVVLGGGVFQNKVLVDLVVEDFAQRSVPLAIPGAIPINDGGIAAGQLAIANAILAKEQSCA